MWSFGVCMPERLHPIDWEAGKHQSIGGYVPVIIQSGSVHAEFAGSGMGRWQKSQAFLVWPSSTNNLLVHTGPKRLEYHADTGSQCSWTLLSHASLEWSAKWQKKKKKMKFGGESGRSLHARRKPRPVALPCACCFSVSCACHGQDAQASPVGAAREQLLDVFRIRPGGPRPSDPDAMRCGWT